MSEQPEAAPHFVKCPDCGKEFSCSKKATDAVKRRRLAYLLRQHECPHAKPASDDASLTPDWSRTCSNCGERPIVPATGLCGPCTFGEAETVGGNW